MSVTGEIKNLYSDKDKTRVLLPRTKTKAVSDENGTSLDVLLDGKAPAGFGLGEGLPIVTTKEEVDALITAGWTRYYAASGSIENALVSGMGTYGYDCIVFTNGSYPILTQEAYCRFSNSCARRTWFDGTWGEWEWVNPPMVIGVEYRTTERWNGKAVYTQMRSGLSFPNASYRDIEFGINNSAKVIRYRHIAYGPDMCEMPMVSGTTVLAYGYFAQANSGLIYRYKTSTDLTSYTESYIQVWYTKE